MESLGSSLGRGWRRGNKCAWTAISAPQETLGGKGLGVRGQ